MMINGIEMQNYKDFAGMTLDGDEKPEYFVPSKGKYCCSIGNYTIYYDLECQKLVSRQKIEEILGNLMTFLQQALEKSDQVQSSEETKNVLLAFISQCRDLQEELTGQIDRCQLHKLIEIDKKAREIRGNLKKNQEYNKMVMTYFDVQNRMKLSNSTSVGGTLVEENKTVDNGKVIGRREFNKIYREGIGHETDLAFNTNFLIDCAQKGFLNLMKRLTCIKLPPMLQIQFQNIPEESKIIREFMKGLVMSSPNSLGLNCTGNLINISSYHSVLVDLFKHSRFETIYIYNCSMDQEQFWDMIEASKHTFGDINFYRCKFGPIEEGDMSQRLHEAGFDRLVLNEGGGSDYSNWVEDENSLLNIISSLGTSQSIRDNMKRIHLNGGEVPEDLVKQALNDAGLSNISIDEN